MKTVLVFVSTLDGKVTKWGNPYVKIWSSHWDQDYFKSIWNDSRVIIIGSNTYFADPIKASSKHLLIVMTRNPLKYKMNEIQSQVEFTNGTPARLVERFEKEGQKQLLIVGGAHIATSFLKEQLIDELWLTIEPKIFGSGGSFVIEEKLDINLQLISSDKVNNQGTLITKYKVIKEDR